MGSGRGGGFVAVGGWGHRRFIAVGRRSRGGLAAMTAAWHILLDADLHRRRATTVQGVRQVAAHIGIAQLARCVGTVMGGQILSVGQQLIDLAIAIGLAGGNACPSSSRALKRAIMQRADGGDGSASARGAQLVTGRQILGICQTGAGRLTVRRRSLSLMLRAMGRHGGHGWMGMS